MRAVEAARHTEFDAERVRRVVERAHALSAYGDAAVPDVTDYASFARNVPVMDGAAYAKVATEAFAVAGTDRYYIGTSSGTSGSPRLILTRNSARRRPQDASVHDGLLVDALLAAGVFRPGEIVANLFGVSHFSVLHHGACRLLEACGVNIVPVGQLAVGEAGLQQLRYLARLGVSALFGTPSSLMQFHALAGLGDVQTHVSRLVFTGEPLGAARRTRLARLGSGVETYGLYGIAECGFIGLGRCDAEIYDVRKDAYFLESDPNGQLLVTALDDKNPVPVVRYATGDAGVLERDGELHTLRHIRRTGLDFNYMANLVSYDELRRVVATVLGHEEFLLQLELREEDNVDVLTLHIAASAVPAASVDAVHAALSTIPELREGEEKSAGRIEVSIHGADERFVTARQKAAYIIDRRFA